MMIMKTRIVLAAWVLFTSPLLANDSKYLETMTKTIAQIYRAQQIEEIQQAVNVFDRIGNAEKDKWEPNYYAAFGYILMAGKEVEAGKKDALLDQAKLYLDKAAALKPNDSEIITLDGFLSTIRLAVDPATRGQKYSMAAMQSFGKALEIDPKNPRAMALMAQMQFGTARFFNASTAEACETAQKAKALFAEVKSDVPSLAPMWGKGMADGMLQNCK